MRWLAFTYHTQMRLEEAEQLFLRLLNILTLRPEKHSEDSLLCMLRLSHIYRSQGRLEEAIHMSSLILDVADNCEAAVSWLVDLAATCQSRGLLEKAEQLLLQLCGSERMLLGLTLKSHLMP